MDDAVDGSIAVCVLLHQVQGTIPITVPLIHLAGSGAVYLDKGEVSARAVVMPLVGASIVVGIKGDLLQLAVMKGVPLFWLPVALGVHLATQQRFPRAIEQ